MLNTLKKRKLTASESVLLHNALRHLTRKELTGTQSVFAGLLFLQLNLLELLASEL